MSNDIETVDTMIPVEREMLVDGLRFVRLGTPLRGEQFFFGESTYTALADWVRARGPRLIVEPVAPIDPPPGYDYGGYGIVPKETGVLYKNETGVWVSLMCYGVDQRVDGGRRHWARKKVEKYAAVLICGQWCVCLGGGEAVAGFCSDNAEQYARAHAAKLNAKETT